MAKKSTFKGNWPKWTLQWATLAALIFFLSGLAEKIFPKMVPADPETYCPVGGLQAFVTYLVRGSLPCSMSSMQIIMGLALAAAVVLFSKLFCAYICPVGSVEDLLGKARRGLGIKAITIKDGGVLDKVLRLVKYVLLFWVLTSTVTASELFCKNLDPYYAVATGFKGEITLWTSLVTVGIVVILGFFMDRFWCKYVCPLGAVSNSLKFWTWMLLLVAVWLLMNVLGLKISWMALLGMWCIVAWALEVFHRNPKMQILHVQVDENKCGKTCQSCRKNCPYGIDVAAQAPYVTSVDCVLCGECVAACPTKALSIGAKHEQKCGFGKYLPAIIAAALFAIALVVGGKFELPTISETWGIEEGMELQTVKIGPLKTVKCYGSSMAFKARMEGVRGVHGVKTYVRSHNVVITYDPKVTNEEKIQEEVFVPSHFRIWSPDPKKLSELKVVTIRTEKMYDKLDLNYLGLQMRNTGKSVFGVESQYDCPLIVRVYMSPDENLDEEWFREIVNKKALSMPVHGGGTKDTPVDFEFVRMEKGESTIGIAEYLENMFDPFTAEFNGRYPSADTTIVRKRFEQYEGQPQFVYEIANQNYEKPIIKRALPYLGNHLSREEGIIGLYLCLNKDLVPCLQVRFAAPMTAERVWELLNEDPWTITYAADDVRQEGARLKFDEPGTVFPYESKEN